MFVIIDFVLILLYSVYYILESLVKTFIPRSWRSKDVSDDIVLITGGGSGIGQLLACRFAKLGSTVVIWDISETGMAETVREVTKIGGRIFTYSCDITKRDEVYKTAQKTKDQVGVVTILVNNAGVVTGKNILEAPDHMIQKTFDVNIIAHFWTVKSFLPDMIKKGKGHIVTIASQSGLTAVNGLADYSASKFAAIGFDEALHLELRAMDAKDIHTTVVCPYYISTGMFEGTYSRLFAILTPAYVVDEILSGILSNERHLLVPRFMHSFNIVKTLLPWKTYLRVFETFVEANKAISTFVGRQPVKQD